MIYTTNNKAKASLSLLGMGCMRFTRTGVGINQQKVERELLYAVENGINYFDTAYLYPGSEVALGKFIAKGYRDKMYIATKLPHYMVKSINDVERFFCEQLKRLQTDYIDYYLFHTLNDVNSWERLKNLGIENWIVEKKQTGRIKNIGFSFHGGAGAFKEVLDGYNWDICYIQYNYLDKTSQAGVDGLKYAVDKGVPVVIMEPLRGGQLANKLPKQVLKMLDVAKVTPAQWAFKWLYNQPEVSIVLSGMNSIEQIEENVRTASQAVNLTENELKLYDTAIGEINKHTKVPCTGCGYCMPCPHGVDIPVCFNAYNSIYNQGRITAMKEYVMCTTMKAKRTNASLCKECGMCEKHCPQNIKISDELKNASAYLENVVYKIIGIVAKYFMK